MFKQPSTWIGIAMIGTSLLEFWEGRTDSVAAWTNAIGGLALVATGTRIGELLKIK